MYPQGLNVQAGSLFLPQRPLAAQLLAAIPPATLVVALKIPKVQLFTNSVFPKRIKPDFECNRRK